MEQSTLYGSGIGRWRVNEMFLQNRCYADIPLADIISLFCDLLLEQEFLREHREVNVNFRGVGTALKLKIHPKHCVVGRAQTNTPSLFPNLAAVVV